MANYIGNTPANGEFKHLDSITSQFNGSTTTFSLVFNGVIQSAGDASQLIVSLNGVIQEPLTAYTLGTGGSTITFSSAPASGGTCFIVMLGGVGGTVTPSDNSVTTAKIAAGAVTSSKISIDGDISFPDNNKAKFGYGSDLEIYHSGTQSIISEVGSGNLNLEGDSRIVLRSTGGSENYAQFFKDGAVELYYNNAVKIATTATGIDVTGTAVMDGLTVDSVDINGVTVAWQNSGTNQTYFTTTGSSEQALILRLDNQNL